MKVKRFTLQFSPVYFLLTDYIDCDMLYLGCVCACCFISGYSRDRLHCGKGIKTPNKQTNKQISLLASVSGLLLIETDIFLVLHKMINSVPEGHTTLNNILTF